MIFDKIREPILFKESNSMQSKIDYLNTIKDNVKEKEKIDKDIKILEAGLYGEKKVLFELLNSHIGMYILNDVYIEYKGLNSQIDFVVITHRNTYYIECKNMIGNIEIDHNGNFIRTFGNTKEGIYSPLTQAQRHMELLRQISVDSVSFLRKELVKNAFPKYHIPLVVLANDKSILYDKYAPINIRKKVIKVDKLIEYIKECDKNAEFDNSDNEMKNIAETYMRYNTDKEDNIVNKYEVVNMEKENDKNLLKEKLRKYRWNKSKEEKVKPYFIFSDKTLEELIALKPSNREQLLKIYGMGENKFDKYGVDILNIINLNK